MQKMMLMAKADHANAIVTCPMCRPQQQDRQETVIDQLRLQGNQDRTWGNQKKLPLVNAAMGQKKAH